MGYSIERINKLEDFLSLEKDWQELLDSSSSDSLFVSFEWFRAWWTAFGNKASLCILVAKDESGRVYGIAPFMKSTRRSFGFPIKRISFMYNDNSSEADFLFLKGKEKLLEIILDYLKLNKSEWHVIEMENILLCSPNYGILLEYLKNKKMTFSIKDGLSSPYIVLNTTFQQYRSTLKKKFQRNLRYIANRLSRLEGCWIERINRFDNEDALRNVFEISKMSWKSRYKVELTSTAGDITFFKELQRSLGHRGWIDIWFFNIKGNAIAYEYVLKYKKRAYALRADYNEAYDHISPGTTIQMQSIQDCIEEGIKVYDFCGHSDEYKKNWTVQSRHHSTVTLYRNNLYGRLMYLIDYKAIYTLKLLLRRKKFFRKIKLLLERIIACAR